MINTIINGDIRDVLETFPDDYVDVIVTSPPYWGRRSYNTASSIWGGEKDCQHEWEEAEVQYDYRFRPGKNSTVRSNTDPLMYGAKVHNSFCQRCDAWHGQLGLEPTFQLFIKHLVEIFTDLKRVLKPTGTCWVVMGDTYITKGFSRHWGYTDPKNPEGRHHTMIEPHALPQSIPEKCMAQIPQRFSIAMTDEGGWILRVIPIWDAVPLFWQKPNPVPESAKDRFTRDYAFILVFSKEKKYYFDTQYEQRASVDKSLTGDERKDSTSDMRIKRCIWNISSKGIDWEFCQHCDLFLEGTERNKIIVQKEMVDGKKKKTKYCPECNQTDGWVGHYAIFPEQLVKTPIWASCPNGGIVLDPFSGSGTTCVVAQKLGYNYIGIDISEPYCRIANHRLERTQHLSRAVMNNEAFQLTLF